VSITSLASKWRGLLFDLWRQYAVCFRLDQKFLANWLVAVACVEGVVWRAVSGQHVSVRLSVCQVYRFHAASKEHVWQWLRAGARRRARLNRSVWRRRSGNSAEPRQWRRLWRNLYRCSAHGAVRSTLCLSSATNECRTTLWRLCGVTTE